MADDAAPRVRMNVLSGDDLGRAWDLDERQVYTLGRSRKCNLRLTDPLVSAVHAEFRCRDGVWRIIDLSSTHGTMVNEQTIMTDKALFDRDVLHIGHSIIEFREYEELDESDLMEIKRGVRLPDE